MSKATKEKKTGRSAVKGCIVEPETKPKINPSPPSNDLKLKAAFGYSGDYRNNISYNKNKEIVYFAAAVGVM